MTFSEFYEVYIDTMSKRLRQSTMLSKRTLFEKKIIPYFKNKKMDEITPNDILQWQNILINSRKRRKHFLFDMLPKNDPQSNQCFI